MGNSQRANQDCFHAHTSEDSCDGDSTDAPLSNRPSQAASTRCMASDYQNDRTIVSSCWLLQTTQSASLSSEGCLLFQSKIHEPSKGYAGQAVSESWVKISSPSPSHSQFRLIGTGLVINHPVLVPHPLLRVSPHHKAILLHSDNIGQLISSNKQQNVFNKMSSSLSWIIVSMGSLSPSVGV